jgi:hypothetical protein
VRILEVHVLFFCRLVALHGEVGSVGVAGELGVGGGGNGDNAGNAAQRFKRVGDDLRRAVIAIAGACWIKREDNQV